MRDAVLFSVMKMCARCSVLHCKDVSTHTHIYIYPSIHKYLDMYTLHICTKRFVPSYESAQSFQIMQMS